MTTTKTTLPAPPLAASLALAALVAASTGAAQAQTDPSEWAEIEDGSVLVELLGMTVGELENASVHDIDGERVGELDDVLMNRDGTEMAVSLDIGGFLGIGERDVVIPVEDLSAGADGLMTVMSREELETLPEFED